MSNQIVISSGAKVRSLEGVLTGTAGIVNSVPLGGANGVATLDALGKVPLSQLPASVVTYLGTWNAATNTPTLTNGVGDVGDLYICNVAGTVNFGAGPITFAVGDWVIYSGTEWQKSSGASGTVTSVAVTESGDALTITGSPITTSGTINIGFAGTGSQYIKGDGTLATFPTTIDQAKRLITEVYNSTGATLSKGTVVYINGGQGNLPTVTKAQANADNTSAQTYGVVQSDITNNNNGFVVVIGSLTDIDTQAYAVGTQLYLSGTTAGDWTSTKPSAPIHLVYVGIVVRSHPTQGVVEIRIQNGYELEELHDVAISAPVNNQGIFYNSSNSLWENKSIATALGYTPADNSLVVHLAGTETITGSKIFNAAITADAGISLKEGVVPSAVGYTGLAGDADGLLITKKIGTTAYTNLFYFQAIDASNTYTFPNLSGTIALLEGTQTFSGAKTFTDNTIFSVSPLFDQSANYKVGAPLVGTGNYISMAFDKSGTGSGSILSMKLADGTTAKAINLDFVGSPATYTYTFPASSGTIALTSNLSSYLPLTGGTLTGALNGTSATFSSVVSAIADSNAASFIAQARTADDLAQIQFKNNAASNTNALISVLKVGTNGGQIQFLTKPDGSPLAASLTLASTGAATFSSSVTATQATFTATANTYAGGSLILKANGGTNPIYLTSVSGYFALSNGGAADHLLINSTGAATFSSSVGIGGLTPFANSLSSSLDMVNGAGLWGYSNDFILTGNAYYNGGWTYKASSYATRINGDGAGAILFSNASSGTAGAALTWNERMRITSTGNVGIGTSSPSTKFHVAGTAANTVAYVSDTTGYALYQLGNSGGGLYYGIDSSTASGFANGAYSRHIYSTGAYPLIISTNDTERMRITSVGFTKSSNDGTYLSSTGSYHEVRSNQANQTLALTNSSSSGNGYYSELVTSNSSLTHFLGYAGGAYRIFIYTNGNIQNFNNSYGAISDIKLKENITDATPKLDDLLKVKIRNYNIIGDETKQLGVVAQELEEIFPSLVSETPDFETDKETGERIDLGTTTKSVKYSVFVPILIKALQESHQIIKDLEARIVTLESKIN